jgi:hypothetical protein
MVGKGEPVSYRRVPDFSCEIAESVAKAALEAPWLTSSDDAAVKVVVSMAVTFSSGHPELGTALMNALSLLGFTPVGRQRLKMTNAEMSDDGVSGYTPNVVGITNP